MLKELLHEQYEADGNLVLFRCSECGQVDLSLGNIHSHIEGHRGYTRFNIQIPFTQTAMADVDELMERTEVLQVNDAEKISLKEVEGL